MRLIGQLTINLALLRIYMDDPRCRQSVFKVLRTAEIKDAGINRRTQFEGGCRHPRFADRWQV